jgi:glyoxylase-like metal-dependent hydrolase (beta-lactamase superfamily II)
MSTEPTPTIGRPDQPAAVRSLTFDDVILTYAVDGVLTTRPETFFPETPSEAWDDLLSPTGDMLVAAGGLLVQTPEATVLIDAGAGDMISQFAFGSVDCGSMLDVLSALGVRPEDVDVLALTHLHFDHAGWAFTDGAKVFPNARYAVAAPEWAPYAAGLDEAAATPRHLIDQFSAHQTDLDLFGDGDEIAPGLRALVTPGHTPGHASYVVTSRTGRRLIAFGDAFNSAIQVTHPEWLCVADRDAAGVAAARRRLLTLLAEPDTLGFGCHFGDQPFGRVVVDATGVASWAPVPSTVVALPR